MAVINGVLNNQIVPSDVFGYEVNTDVGYGREVFTITVAPADVVRVGTVLEVDYVAKNECLKEFNYLIIKASSDKAARKIRVARLVQLEWQLHYAYVYWKIANEIEFETRSFKDKKEKIRFLATAYNCGFRRPQKQIENRLNKAMFPFGSKYKGTQVAYGDLAVEFWEHHLKKFN